MTAADRSALAALDSFDMGIAAGKSSQRALSVSLSASAHRRPSAEKHDFEEDELQLAPWGAGEARTLSITPSPGAPNDSPTRTASRLPIPRARAPAQVPVGAGAAAARAAAATGGVSSGPTGGPKRGGTGLGVAKGGGGTAAHAPAPEGEGPTDLPARLAERDREIERLEAILLVLEPPPGMSMARLVEAGRGARTAGVAAPDPRDAKLLELAKRTRELTRSVAREAERADKGVAEAARWRAAGEREARGRMEAESAPASLDAQRALQSNLGRTVKERDKAWRERDRAFAELRACHRILRKEVGPDVPIPRLLAAHGVASSCVLEGEEGGGEEGEGGSAPAGPGWRGRAQVISLLRARLKAVERGGRQAGRPLLDEGGPSDAAFGVGDAEEGEHGVAPAHTAGAGSGAHVHGGGFDVDDRAVATLAVQRASGARAVETARSEAVEAKGERDRWKGEAASARARCSVLEGEVKKLRAHVRTLLDKSEGDDKLIAGLGAQVGALRATAETLRKANVSAAFMGLGGSSSQGGEGEGELEELRRASAASERAVTALRVTVRALREALEANGIDSPLRARVGGGHGSPPRGGAELPLSRPVAVYSTGAGMRGNQ